MAKRSSKVVGIIVAIIVIALIVGGIAFMLGQDRATDDLNGEPVDTQTQQDGQPANSNPEGSQINDDPGANPDSEESTDGIAITEAEQVALDRFGGTIDEIKANTHNGTPIWEVDIRDGSEGDVEVYVDRQTGEIIAWERN